jgi:hypothetical protein
LDIEFTGITPHTLWLASHLPSGSPHIDSYVENSLLDGLFHDIRLTKRRDDVAEFYLDGALLGTLPAPSGGGYIIINNWSTGNPRWSGTPFQDTVAVVESVQFYYD